MAMGWFGAGFGSTQPHPALYGTTVNSPLSYLHVLRIKTWTLPTHNLLQLVFYLPLPTTFFKISTKLILNIMCATITVYTATLKD